jgi:hypothetical protein
VGKASRPTLCRRALEAAHDPARSQQSGANNPTPSNERSWLQAPLASRSTSTQTSVVALPVYVASASSSWASPTPEMKGRGQYSPLLFGQQRPRPWLGCRITP